MGDIYFRKEKDEKNAVELWLHNGYNESKGGGPMTEKVSTELRQICRIITETVEVEKIYLFGSHAYGTPRQDSDYDLCVIIPDDTLRPVDAMVEIRRALYPIQETPLDILVYRENRFLQRIGQAGMERKIEQEGVLLYECRKAARQVV